MKIPEVTPINVKHHKELLRLDSEMAAIQRMMQMFQQTCQARLVETQTRARELWGEIGRDTGIDMQNVTWEPHATDPVILPVQVRVKSSASGA